MTDHKEIDRAKPLEEAQRLLRAALDTIFPGQFPLHLTDELSEEGTTCIEVGNGDAALEPVEVTVQPGLGGGSHQALYWRVYAPIDASDPSVGLFGTELEPAQPYGKPYLAYAPGRLTQGLAHDLGISDDVLHQALAHHELVVTRCWSQDGCYASLGDAIRHIVNDLVDNVVAGAVENEAITISIERGEI